MVLILRCVLLLFSVQVSPLLVKNRRFFISTVNILAVELLIILIFIYTLRALCRRSDDPVSAGEMVGGSSASSSCLADFYFTENRGG